MMKRRIAALVYVCAVLLWGEGYALYLSSPALSDLEVVSALVVGSQGLTILTNPLGLLAGFFVRIMIDIGFEEWDIKFALVTPLLALIGYWQWFHLFPRLYSRIAWRRQWMQDLKDSGHRHGLLDRVVGMKRSRAVFLYVFVVLIVGLTPLVLNRLPFFVHSWLTEAGFYGYANFARSVTVIGLTAMPLLTFPAGALFFETVGVPLILIGVATPEEVLFLTTPFAALLGAVQWFWLLPKLYRQKTGIADAF